eukprot:4765015-Heterocapsa_arctica.AAC.1
MVPRNTTTRRRQVALLQEWQEENAIYFEGHKTDLRKPKKETRSGRATPNDEVARSEIGAESPGRPPQHGANHAGGEGDQEQVAVLSEATQHMFMAPTGHWHGQDQGEGHFGDVEGQTIGRNPSPNFE